MCASSANTGNGALVLIRAVFVLELILYAVIGAGVLMLSIWFCGYFVGNAGRWAVFF